MLVNIEKAAYMLSLKPEQLKRALKKEKIPHIRLTGRNYLFNVEDLKKWVEKRKN
ncbi:helix-turn-helix domain-containing protein [Thermodesulfovibrio sp. 3907-1M]|uniref:Helix-turn-helix domain-containing protein n=1 Tax=Thermodesulfovibrio autotrophicus TaxID=3118333 RepID=A0AAU8GZN1_9BACT